MKTSQKFTIHLIIVLFLFSIVQCTSEDNDEVESSILTVSGQIQIGSSLIDLDMTGDILDNPGSILTGTYDTQNGNGVIFSGVGLSDNSSNIDLRIIANACGITSNDSNSIVRLRNAINDELEQSIIDLEIIIDQEPYSNVNLARNLVFENGCSILTQRDTQGTSTQVVGEDDLIDGFLIAPLSFTYVGFLYNMEETDSIFVEDLSFVFPIVNF